MKKRSKAVFWLIVLLALSALTIYIIVSSNDGFSLNKFLDCLETISPVWFVLAAACAFGFIYFEGAALRCICHRLGCDFKRSRATVYAATDIYFSDITPSAAGGQPAAMVLMMKDGIPGAVAAIALVLNLAMYTLAILVLSLIAFLLNFDMFLGFDFPAQLFIGIGGVVQVAFIVLFAMCIFKKPLVHSLAAFILRLLCKLRILKNYEAHLVKLDASVEQYNKCGELIRHEYGFMLKVFLLNVAQRMSVISVALCIFLGSGGSLEMLDAAFSAQTFAVLGSNAVPLPGAVGVVDYIFLTGFETIVSDPVSVELISRGLSFYASFIFCGIVFLIEIAVRKIRTGKDAGESQD